MSKQSDYRRYLQSPVWQVTRARRLALADYRCEFKLEVGSYKNEPVYGERCTETSELHVHHRHYRTVGAERDSDLEVLCCFHHLVRHAEEGCECAYCGEIVEVDQDEAIETVKEAVVFAKGVVKNVSIDDVRSQDNVCDYCDHMWSKDD